MQWKRRVFDTARRTGALGAAGRLWGGDRVTVLAYHRVVDHHSPHFDTYRTNVSADPEGFDAQMEWAAAHFDPIDLTELAAARRGASLPERPLLVTFDDGYRDNFTQALPIARSHGIPLTVFLATDHIGTSRPFYWDLAAYCFHHTTRDEAFLPILGRRSLGDATASALDEWVAAAKTLPEHHKQSAVEALPESLGVSVPPDAFDGLLLDWDDVAHMQDQGVHFGAHTCDHPILTRIPTDEMRRQVMESKREVERHTGEEAIGFAYPNGLAADFDAAAVDAVSEAGFDLAFSLLPGPSRRREIIARPFEVRRTYVYWGDHLSRFVAKVSGLARMAAAWR